MIVTYDIYRRYCDRDRDDLNVPIENDIYYGKRFTLLQDYQTLSLTLNWSKRSKFTLKGNAVNKAPFELGDTILIYRNAVLLFTGMVDRVSIECEDVTSETIEWTAEGEDEGVIFDWRVILTDYDQEKGFQDLTFKDDVYDKCESFTYDRLVHYIRSCFDEEITIPGREISGMTFPIPEDLPEDVRGTSALSAYRQKKLSDVLDEIGKDEKMFPQYQWNPITGEKKVFIPLQRDMTDSIVISPQFGNVSKWTVSRTYPKCNAIWVCSGEYSSTEPVEGSDEEKQFKTRVWVYAEDTESIHRYGRIEKIFTKSDVKITDDDEKTEEDETLTEEDVIALLEEEARKNLEENAAKEKYTITLAEIDELHFMEDWQCGDKVKVVIDGKEFTSTIETVSISYSNLTEKLKPTIGAVEEGMFSEIFEMISGIDKRLENEEEA